MYDPGKVPPKNEFHIQKWMEENNSGLALVSFQPDDGLLLAAAGIPGMNYPASRWIGHASNRFQIDPRWILMTMQAEQSLALDRHVHRPDFTVEIFDGPVMGLGRTFKVAGQRKWVRVTGDWQMLAACGAGLFPNGECWKPDVFGFGSQIYHCAKWTRKYLELWASGERKPSPEMTPSSDLIDFCARRWVGFNKAGEERRALLRSMFNLA